MFKNRILFAILVFSAALIFHSSTVYAQSYSIKPIVTSETELIPGSNLRINSVFSHDLSINNNGDIVFFAYLSNTSDGTFSSGIILFSKGEVKLVAKEVVSLSVSEGEFLDISSPDINDDGTVVFWGSLFRPGKVINHSIYKLVGNEIVPVVSPGDPVQGSDAAISNVPPGSKLSLNNNGDIAFNAILSDGSKGLFLFTNEAGIEPVLLVDDPNYVFNAGKILQGVRMPIINDKGEIVFVASFFENDEFLENQTNKSSGVFLFREGEIIPVKLPGAEAPGTNGMVFWDEHTSWMTLGNNSEVVYDEGYLVPGGNSNAMKDRRGIGLFLWTEDNTRPLILTGDIVPGTESNFLFHNGTFTKDAINDHGEMVASLVTKDGVDLFLISGENITPVVLSKESNQNRGKEFLYPGTAAINNRGDIVFFGKDIYGRDEVFLAIKEE